MKNKLLLVIAILLCFACWQIGKVHAQAVQAATFSGTAPHTTCITPATGAYYLCVASDGVWVSNNGGAYFQIVPTAAAGVTSIAVNGGTAQTGAIALTIPTSATTIVTSSATTTIK